MCKFEYVYVALVSQQKHSKQCAMWNYGLHLAWGAQNETWYADVTAVHAGGTKISSLTLGLLSSHQHVWRIQLEDTLQKSILQQMALAVSKTTFKVNVCCFWIGDITLELYPWCWRLFTIWDWLPCKVMTSPHLQHLSAFLRLFICTCRLTVVADVLLFLCLQHLPVIPQALLSYLFCSCSFHTEWCEKERKEFTSWGLQWVAGEHLSLQK